MGKKAENVYRPRLLVAQQRTRLSIDGLKLLNKMRKVYNLNASLHSSLLFKRENPKILC